MPYSTHRKLEDSPGIFTFITLSLKDPNKKKLSLEVYMNPELFQNIQE